MSQSERPEIFYHYTCRLYWPFIETAGIDRGEAPISATKQEQWPNLTVNPDAALQGWTRGGALDKTAVRITVRIPDAEIHRLISFREFADSRGMSRQFYKELDRTGSWGARHWYYYMGTIPTEWFTDVTVAEDRPLSPFEERALAVAAVSPDYNDLCRRMGMKMVGGGLVSGDPLDWDFSPVH